MNQYISILRNNGSGTFTQSSTPGVGSNPVSVISGDFNGDGYLDLVVANNGSNTVSILTNKSNLLMTVSPNKIPYGVIAIGTSKNVYLKITNNKADTTNLYISNITSSNTVFTVNQTTLAVSPNTSDSVLVTFTPTQPLTYDDTLTIYCNDPLKPIVKVALSGSGKTPPAQPQNLVATSGNTNALLSWNANTEGDFLKYLIYMGTDSSSVTLKDSTTASITDTSKTITGLTNGVKYYFRVSAIDTLRFESTQSYAASATPSSTPKLVTLASISYGTLEALSNRDTTLIVKNDGGVDLIVSSTTISGTNSNQYSIVSGGGNFTLTPAQSRSIVLRFTPTSAGTKNAQLVFVTNDLSQGSPAGTISVSLTGIGADTQAPKSPVNAIISPDTWTNFASFTVAFQKPADETSEIKCVWYNYDTAPSAGNLGTCVTAVMSGDIGTATIPSPATTGIHQLYIYLEDTLNNKDANTNIALTAKYDATLPTIQHDSLLVQAFNTNNPLPIAIAATATDAHSLMKSLKLEYRRAGTSWSTASSLNYTSSTGGTVNIPANDITTNAIAGVDYRIVAQDSANNATYSPTHSLSITHNSDITRTDGNGSPITHFGVAALPTGVPAEMAYRIFSVPLNLDNKTPLDVLANKTGLGSYDIKKWRFLCWNNSSNNFQEYPSFQNDQVLTPGSAFFLILKTGAVIKVGPGTIVKSEDMAKYGIPLQAGYNVIGNPFTFDLPIDSLKLGDGQPLLNKVWHMLAQVVQMLDGLLIRNI